MPRGQSHSIALLGAVLAAASIAGCQVYKPELVLRDGGVDTGPPIDAGPCSPVHPPSRPEIADSPDGPIVSFAMRRSILDQGDRWVEIGYDVDDICTRAPDYQSECRPPSMRNPITDGNDGIDNVFGGEFFPIVVLTTPDLETAAQSAQEAGEGNPMLRVLGWNGMPDNPRVDIHIMQAVFAAPGDAMDTTPPDPPPPEGMRVPAWDGSDWVWVRRDAFLAGDLTRPLIRDDNAYVAGDTFVARLPDRIDIIFPADTYGVLVRVTGAIATGHLDRTTGDLDRVIVSGRWSVNDLLMTAQTIGVCEGSSNYTLLLQQLDRIADVRSTPGTGGPGTVCDAISLGIEFIGTQVRIAGTEDGLPLRDLCAMPLEDGGVRDAGSDGGSDAGIVVMPDSGPPTNEDAGIDAGGADAGG